MKIKRNRISKDRFLLDEKLSPFVALRDTHMPKGGWLKATRNALGLSIMQLSKRLKCRDTGILRLEQREEAGTASLAALDRAARAMHCRLVWSVVPESGYPSLSDIAEKRALRLATQMVHRVDQTMRLESQATHAEIVRKQIEELAGELIRNGDSRIWEPLEDDAL
jgi:predicted DNA-binding mobile mystery protein A